VTPGREEYDLAWFLYNLPDGATGSHRHKGFLDLADQSVFSVVAMFAQCMREARAHLAQSDKLRYRHQAESWFVDAVDPYRHALLQLADNVRDVALRSRVMSSLRSYLLRYTGGVHFACLVSTTWQVCENLAQVHHCVHYDHRYQLRREVGAPSHYGPGPADDAVQDVRRGRGRSGPTRRRPSSLISSARRTRRCAAASSNRSWPE
jgi:hypothetical protein